MKALQIDCPGEFQIKEVPLPEPGPGEVLLKVLAVTTCPHWDMHIMAGIPMLNGLALNYPYTLGQPGHEACAEVAALGPGVTDYTVGDRVCTWIDIGHHVPGCYAQYLTRGAEYIIRVPATIKPEHCAPLELAMCASAWLLRARQIEPLTGQRVGVFGLGPAGLIFIQLLRAEGAAEIVAFDPLPERRELARRLGADVVLDVNDPRAVDFPRIFQPGSLDVAFDCVGLQSVMHHMLAVTTRLISVFAVQREPYTIQPDAWGRLSMTFGGVITRQAAEHAVARLTAGQLDFSPLVSAVMPLDGYGRAVELLKQKKALKVAFLPQES